MTRDDDAGQIHAGTTAAIMHLIAMVVDELDQNGMLNKSGLAERIGELASNYEGSISSENTLRDQMVVHQLRAFLQLLEFREKPAWTPSVISGKKPANED